MTYNHVTVIARYQDESGNGQSGVVQWAPTGPIVDSVLHVTITPDTDNITLDGTGTATASLLAMDDTNLSTGWVWAFKPTVSGVPNAIQYVAVDYANGATQYIDQLAPVVPTTGMAAYATAAMLTTETAARIAGDAATLSSATTVTGTETSRATAAEALLAPKASPALTGTPTAPTATALTSSTQIATTAYTDSAVAAGGGGGGAGAALLVGATFTGQVSNTLNAEFHLDSFSGTDDAKMVSAIAAVVAAGGGIITLGARSHTFANQWATSYVSNTVTSAIIIRGSGVAFNGSWGAASAATTVTFTYTGAGTAMMDFQHNGTIEIYGIQFIQANLGIAFFQTTNAAPDVHNCIFSGGGNEPTCQTDGILLGGTGTTTGSGDTAKFNAYQANIHNNFFDGIRRLVFFQSAANACNVYNNTASASCGSNLFQGAAFEMQGNSTKSCTGNTLYGNCVEISGYAVGCKMSYAVQNTLGPNGFFDPTTARLLAPYMCDIHCTSNEFIDGYRTATTPFVIGSSSSNNIYRTALRGAGINVLNNQVSFKPSGAALIPQVYGASGRGIVAVGNIGDQAGWVTNAISVANPYPATSAYTIAAAPFTDGSTVSGSNWITSLTAAFVVGDVGQAISGAGITTATAIEATYTTSTAQVWHTTTAFNVGDVVRPSTANAHLYQATVAGTSGSSAPTFPTSGGTVTDGGVTWSDIGASTAAYITNSATVTATGVTISIARSTGTLVVGPSMGRGHLISRGTVAAPTVAIGAGLGTVGNSATATLAGFDMAHTLTLTSASTALPSGGLLCTVTFAIPYFGNAPRIVFSPSNAAAAGISAALYSTKAVNTYTLTALASPALAVSTIYTFDVLLVE